MNRPPPSHFRYIANRRRLYVYLQHPDAGTLDSVKNTIEPRSVPGLRVHMGWDNSAVALEIENVMPEPPEPEPPAPWASPKEAHG